MKPEHIRCAIILMKRAPIKGEEAAGVAESIGALEQMYNTLTTNPLAPPDVETEDDDTATD